MNVKFPYQFNAEGRTASANNHAHIRDLIEQILFTNQGERVNRPTFGSGLLQAVFEPNSYEMAATTQTLIQSALNQLLGNVIEVNEVEVTNIDAVLEVKLVYTVLINQEKRSVAFSKDI